MHQVGLLRHPNNKEVGSQVCWISMRRMGVARTGFMTRIKQVDGTGEQTSAAKAGFEGLDIGTSGTRALPGKPFLPKVENHFLPKALVVIILAILGFGGTLCAQTNPSPQTAPPSANQKQEQDIPDAPSTVQPPKPAPPETPPPEQAPPEAAPPGAQAEPPPANEPSPRQNPVPDQGQTPPGKPPINIRTVPEGGATPAPPERQGDVFKIRVLRNQDLVPVTVKDETGRP